MKYYILGLILILISACTFSANMTLEDPTETPQVPDKTPVEHQSPDTSAELNIENPYAPRDDDGNLTNSNAYLEEASWDAATQTLRLTGNLPTPCSELRVSTILDGPQMVVHVYSVSSPGSMCAQVIENFDVTLKIENLTQFAESLYVNGEMIEI